MRDPFLRTMVILVLILIGLIFYANKKDGDFKQLCESKGGKVLRGRDLQECVDPKIFIKVD